MKTKLIAIFVFFVASIGLVMAAKGFDEFGYNRQAGIFVGPVSGWCLQRGAPANCYGVYSNDRLVMKWNAEWDRGNAEKWKNPPYNAWLNNEWNGKVPRGSGETWHYNIKWVGACGRDGTPLPDGGYCIWGQFEVLLSHGTVANEHFWDAHAIPTGYGS